jgi:ankyrin repeat protein
MIHNLIKEIIYEHYDNVVSIINIHPNLINELDNKCGFAINDGVMPLTLSALHACNDVNHSPVFAERVTRLLLTHGATIIPDSNGNTPLHYACGNGNLACVESLMSYGADYMCKNNYGVTPYDMAMHFKRFNVIDYFDMLDIKEPDHN